MTIIIQAADPFSEEAKRSGTYGSIEDFNDHVTHADVLRLFDRAIERAEASS